MNTRRPTRLRRSFAALAGLAVAALVLSACIASEIPDATGTGSAEPRESLAPNTDGVADDVLSFYEQTLEWTDCESAGFDCTTVTAPLDWDNPEKGQIELSVVRHKSTNTPMGSLLTNPGGPGASGIELVADSLEYAVGDDLIDNYDIIGFDPRGVGQSTAVTCYDATDMDAYLYDIPTAARGTQEWTDELLAAHKSFAEACDANSDGILPYITTINSARDMDLLRGVLGDAKLNYLGYSYGTFLGATYAELYPERTGKLVLDGALDPAVSGLDVSATQAIGFESALRAYMTDCLSTTGCPFTGTLDEAMSDLQALLASVDAKPLENGDGRELGADALITAIITPLYSEDNWPVLTQLLTGVLQGDASVAMYVADQYNGRNSDGSYADNSSEAFRAYNCMDYPVEDDPDAEAAMMAKIEAGAPTFAPYWNGPDSCSVWPYPPTGTRGEIHAEGSAPILVVGTTNDPATPYEWSESLAQQLDEGVLITRVGEGHTGYNKGNSCVDDAVNSYFVDGTVPSADVRCE